jgi:hypothetical protein
MPLSVFWHYVFDNLFIDFLQPKQLIKFRQKTENMQAYVCHIMTIHDFLNIMFKTLIYLSICLINFALV